MNKFIDIDTFDVNDNWSLEFFNKCDKTALLSSRVSSISINNGEVAIGFVEFQDKSTTIAILHIQMENLKMFDFKVINYDCDFNVENEFLFDSRDIRSIETNTHQVGLFTDVSVMFFTNK